MLIRAISLTGKHTSRILLPWILPKKVYEILDSALTL
jgi:hypothetical protein